MVPVTHLTPYEKLEKFTELLSQYNGSLTHFLNREECNDEVISKITRLPCPDRSGLTMTLYEIATLPSVTRNDITDRRDACPTIPLEVLHHK
jgi:hypothetical protein